MRERTRLDNAIDGYRKIERELDDAVELIELAEAEGDRPIVAEAESDLAALKAEAPSASSKACCPARPTPTTAISKSTPAPAAPRRRTGPRCCCACICAGPRSTATRSSGWRKARAKRPGIKSATIKVIGPNAYGWLKTESGVHRLVRISPFDARRGATPASPRPGSIRWSTTRSRSRSTTRICRIDTYRASGAGGQHVNKTDSAIRITHIPTGDRRRRARGALAAPEPGDRLGDAAGPALRAGTAEARGGGRRAERRPRPISAGATRSAPTCCSPTRWSRTCAPGVETGNPARCSTATSTGSSKPRSPRASRASRARSATWTEPCPSRYVK